MRHGRIALVVPSIAGGGGIPAVARFLRETVLAVTRHDVKLISLSTSHDDPSSLLLTRPETWVGRDRLRLDRWDGHPYTHVGAIGGELEFQRYRPRRALTELVADCDLVQVVAGSPAWANSVCGIGKPVSLHVASRARVERRLRNVDSRNLQGWWRKKMTEVTDQLDDRALRHVNAIQVMNPWMLDYVRQFNAGRDVDVRYAPPGVDGTLFRPVPNRSSERDSYIFCVARLDDPRKNVGLLLDAYSRLPKAVRKRTRLKLAGSSRPPPAFFERASALGLRDMIDYVASPSREKLVGLYQSATVFALPSDEEGFGVVLLESMACGVPAVSTRSGGPDGIITDGKDGFLVPLDDAAQMADRLGQLLMSPAINLTMGLEARRTIEARYAESVASEAFVDVWDRLLAKAQKTGCAA